MDAGAGFAARKADKPGPSRGYKLSANRSAGVSITHRHPGLAPQDRAEHVVAAQPLRASANRVRAIEDDPV
jgi:hypothetical protein